MNYEEALIDGVLMYRESSPAWTPLSAEALSRRVTLLEKELSNLTNKYYKYIKVVGTVPELVTLHIEKGHQFYNTYYNPVRRVDFEKLDVFALDNWIQRGYIHTREEV